MPTPKPLATFPPAPAEVVAKAILKAAPQVIPAAHPSESQMGSWLPPQNAWAGGLAGVVTWLIVHALGQYVPSLNIPPDLVSYVVAFIVAYFVPPAAREVIQHSTDATVQAAMADPKSNVSYVQPPVQPPLGEPAVIVPPATKVI